MPTPVETHQIILKEIRESGADVATKELATKVAQLTKQVDKLSQALKRNESTYQDGTVSMDTLRRDLKRTGLREKAISDLSTEIKKLEADLDRLPKGIQRAVESGQRQLTAETRRIQAGRPVGGIPEGKEIVLQLKNLVNSFKRIERSATFAGGSKDLLKAISDIAKNLTSQQKSVDALAKAVQELSRQLAVPAAERAPRGAATRLPEIKELTLLGKELKDLGSKFDEFKKKVVVALDIETSAIRGRGDIPDFITQIGYKKGTLEKLLADKVKTEQIFVKPPALTKEDYLKALTKGVTDPKLIEKLEKMAVPFEVLEKQGKDASEAMKELADVLKDATVVIGHNVAEFDIKVIQDQFKKAGAKINIDFDKIGTEVEGFIDTLREARQAFPSRQGLKKLTKL